MLIFATPISFYYMTLMRISNRILLLCLLLCLLWACSRQARDNRLVEIAAMVSDNPQEALDRLHRINSDSLSKADRHYFDFLTIKAKDKAYVYHTSDSLICDVINYAASHKKEGYYAEALYYAGRVYSDLGDSPNALRYYQEALDQFPDDTKDLNLKCRILNQTGYLLNILRLYEEAVPYISEALEINKTLNDTISVIYNLQLLGNTALRAGNFDQAQQYLNEALILGENFSKGVDPLTKAYLAQTKYRMGDLESALSLIRGLPEQSDSVTRNSALGYAANIYLKAGKLDSAYMYANQLIHSTDPAHQETGYQVLLAPELRKFTSTDSSIYYISRYRELLNSYHNQHKAQLAINQEALYNYQLHERERIKAEKKGEIIRSWLTGIISFLVLALAYIFYLKYRHKNRVIRLQQALNLITELELQLKNSKNPSAPIATKPIEEELCKEKRNKILSVLEESEDNIEIESKVLESPTYLSLQQLIAQGNPLKENDPLWEELEKLVTSVSPEFRKKLTLLTDGKLSVAEFQLALLIKCAIRPSHMLILLGRTNGALISRRNVLAKKIFDHKVSAKDFYKLIRLL